MKKNEFIVVSGGTSNIGKEIIYKLVKRNNIIFTYNKSLAEAKKIIKKVNSESSNYAVAVKLDLFKKKDIDNLRALIYGHIAKFIRHFLVDNYPPIVEDGNNPGFNFFGALIFLVLLNNIVSHNRPLYFLARPLTKEDKDNRDFLKKYITGIVSCEFNKLLSYASQILTTTEDCFFAVDICDIHYHACKESHNFMIHGFNYEWTHITEPNCGCINKEFELITKVPENWDIIGLEIITGCEKPPSHSIVLFKSNDLIVLYDPHHISSNKELYTDFQRNMMSRTGAFILKDDKRSLLDVFNDLFKNSIEKSKFDTWIRNIVLMRKSYIDDLKNQANDLENT